ncbi:MAG: hypothetical protein JSV80_17150 [Acidobacteriota bacterium]|nr:MAG: hypothetical protein JSV80_17150 [Acidobacteriota bacterium]
MLHAAALQIWTDVPGMFTTDPRRTPVARLIRRLAYREAQELAAMGAKVLHPRCLVPVAAGEIPVTVHSTNNPSLEGTRIERTGRALAACLSSLPDVRWIDVGGGLGVVNRPGQPALDLNEEQWGTTADRSRT